MLTFITKFEQYPFSQKWLHLTKPLIQINRHVSSLGCNIDLSVTETTQYIATEGYPDNYRNNQNCSFNFVAPPGRRITVLFEDFQLEWRADFLHFRKLYSMNTQIIILVGPMSICQLCLLIFGNLIKIS